MDKGVLFWVLYVLAIVFGFGWRTVGNPADRRFIYGDSLFWFVLMGILGWHCFGPVVR